MYFHVYLFIHIFILNKEIYFDPSVGLIRSVSILSWVVGWCKGAA